MLLFVELIKALEDLLIELVLNECPFDDCIGLDKLIIENSLVDAVDFLCPELVFLLFLFLDCRSWFSFLEDFMDSEVDLPKYTLNDIGDDIDIHDMHEAKVKIDVCVVPRSSEDKVICDCWPSSFEQDLDVYILRVH